LVIPAGITILSSNYFILSGLFSSYVYLIFCAVTFKSFIFHF